MAVLWEAHEKKYTDVRARCLTDIGGFHRGAKSTCGNDESAALLTVTRIRLVKRSSGSRKLEVGPNVS